MTKWQISDVPCVVILATENPLVKSTTSAEQVKEIQPPSLDFAPNTTEAIWGFMGWEEKHGKENTK